MNVFTSSAKLGEIKKKLHFKIFLQRIFQRE